MIEPLLIGGTILGGGGGGSLEGGKKIAMAAFSNGTPRLIAIDELQDPDDIVVSVSAVGAPAATGKFVQAKDYNRVVELMTKELPKKPAALITNEMGGGSTFNAFIQSSSLGIPMVDAACNGRAHPLGTMGSMGLSESETYTSIQTSAGGNPETNQYMEVVVRGSVKKTSSIIRSTSVQAGGLIVVARNPVPVNYIKEHAAIGSLTQALEVGMAYLAGNSPFEKIENAVKFLGGQIICSGPISAFDLQTTGGLDVGSVTIAADATEYKMTIWNEYMSLNELKSGRIYTFPDLIMTFDAVTGFPLTSAELAQKKKNLEIVIIAVPYKKLLLGSGMFEKSGYEAIEEAVGIEILPYVGELIR